MESSPSPEASGGLSSTRLLACWYAGDDDAVDELIRRHESWIRRRVTRRLGDHLRARLESSDIVQDALLRFCKYGPKVRVANDDQLRRLLTTIVENTIRDKHDFFSRIRRDIARDRPMSELVVVDLDRGGNSNGDPSRGIEDAERHAMLRLALELLPAGDREVVLLRTREGLSFPEIAERTGSSTATADQRFRRAMPKLEKLIATIASGSLPKMLEDSIDDS